MANPDSDPLETAIRSSSCGKLDSCASERILRSHQAQFRNGRKHAVHRVHAGYHSADASDLSADRSGRRPRKRPCQRSSGAIARCLAQGSENSGGTHGGDGTVPSSLVSQKLHSAGDIRRARQYDAPRVSYREKSAIPNYRAREEGRKAPRTSSQFQPLKINPTSQAKSGNWHDQGRRHERFALRTAASGRSGRTAALPRKFLRNPLPSRRESTAARLRPAGRSGPQSFAAFRRFPSRRPPRRSSATLAPTERRPAQPTISPRRARGPMPAWP